MAKKSDGKVEETVFREVEIGSLNNEREMVNEIAHRGKIGVTTEVA